jgi:acyl-CoA thioester hydrolase
VSGPEGAAHVYLAHVRVRHHQLDPLGHVNNAAYLNFLEQAAIDHAAAAGYDVARLRQIGGLFIASRHEVDYLAPAAAGDRLEIRTWAVSLRGARAIRAYEIRRLPPAPLTAPPPADALLAPADLPPPSGDLVVRARTEWAFVDAATGRPRRIPDEMAAAFLSS